MRPNEPGSRHRETPTQGRADDLGRRPPVPDPYPVHRDVRARPRAAGVPAGLRAAMDHISLPYPDIAT